MEDGLAVFADYEPELLAVEIVLQELELKIAALQKGLARLQKILEEAKDD